LIVQVNREEIQQVLMNLVINAEHALGELPGSITIRTHAGEHAHSLQVIDDGPGISDELKGRIFEPFFTTKDVGQGTGLGLSIALGIATAHGGSLRLLPTTRGACFDMTLPVGAVPPSEAVSAVPRAESSTESHRIRHALVIEDEFAIRTLIAKLLERRGYTVREAPSLVEAQRAADERRFDLVLCDLRLPDGNGTDCLRYMRGVQPDVEERFVFVTGDIGALTQTEREFGRLAVLHKPFTASDLDRMLADLNVGV
jgi:CheY-like chemotaxis protein